MIWSENEKFRYVLNTPVWLNLKTYLLWRFLSIIGDHNVPWIIIYTKVHENYSLVQYKCFSYKNYIWIVQFVWRLYPTSIVSRYRRFLQMSRLLWRKGCPKTWQTSSGIYRHWFYTYVYARTCSYISVLQTWPTYVTNIQLSTKK